MRWPLHSPRRLVCVLAAVVALVWLLVAVGPPAVADAASGTSRPGANPTARTGTPAPAPSTVGATSTPAVASPVEGAAQFVTAWARPDLPVQAWQTDVIALATFEFGAQLRTVLPANVPARRVLGAAAVGSVTELAAAMTVPTDAGPVVIDLAATSAGWTVSGLTPTASMSSHTDEAGSSLAATYTPLPAGVDRWTRPLS